MKRFLLTAALLVCLGAVAQAHTSGGKAVAEPPTDTRHSASGPEEGDRLPTFQGISPKESLARFREWFRNAYLREFRLYKKKHKATYKYEKGDFQDVVVQFVIDTTGRAILHSTRPVHLSEVQTDVLLATFGKAPLWTPAVQKGRMVKYKFTMPVRE